MLKKNSSWRKPILIRSSGKKLNITIKKKLKVCVKLLPRSVNEETAYLGRFSIKKELCSENFNRDRHVIVRRRDLYENLFSETYRVSHKENNVEKKSLMSSLSSLSSLWRSVVIVTVAVFFGDGAVTIAIAIVIVLVGVIATIAITVPEVRAVRVVRIVWVVCVVRVVRDVRDVDKRVFSPHLNRLLL